MWAFHICKFIDMEREVNKELKGRQSNKGGGQKLLLRFEHFDCMYRPACHLLNELLRKLASPQRNEAGLTLWHQTLLLTNIDFGHLFYHVISIYLRLILPLGSRLRFSDGDDSKGGYKLCRYCGIYELCSSTVAFSAGNILTTYTSHFILW